MLSPDEIAGWILTLTAAIITLALPLTLFIKEHTR